MYARPCTSSLGIVDATNVQRRAQYMPDARLHCAVSMDRIKWIKSVDGSNAFFVDILPGHSYNSPIPSCCFYAYMPVRCSVLAKEGPNAQERSHGNFLSFLLSLLAVCSLTASQQPVHWTLDQKSPPSTSLLCRGNGFPLCSHTQPTPSPSSFFFCLSCSPPWP